MTKHVTPHVERICQALTTGKAIQSDFRRSYLIAHNLPESLRMDVHNALAHAAVMSPQPNAFANMLAADITPLCVNGLPLTLVAIRCAHDQQVQALSRHILSVLRSPLTTMQSRALMTQLSLVPGLVEAAMSKNPEAVRKTLMEHRKRKA